MTLSETLNELSDEQLAVLLGSLEDTSPGSVSASAAASSGRNVLVAYYVEETAAVATDSTIEQVGGLVESELRDYCKKRLPSHMCPVRFVALNQFPSLPNGKLDYKRLPAPVRSARTDEPATAKESDSENLILLIGLLKNLLGMDEVRPTDNFFEIGGDSITAIQVISQARTAGLAIGIADVTQSNSIAEIATLSTQEQVSESGVETSANEVPGNFAASGLSENEIDDFLDGLE